MKILLVLLFALLLFPFAGNSQTYSLLKDTAALQEVEEITELIYNNQHPQARGKLKLLQEKFPTDHPVFPMLEALNLYWQEAPMHTGSPHYKEFSSYLRKTVENAAPYLERKQDEILVNFLALSAHSLLTRFHADKGNYIDAVGEAKNAYSFMKKGFELTEKYSEFYFPVGLYNYFREKYPEIHPVYKPFMFFFRSGDMELGLKQLHYASRHNVFTKPESGVFLVHIYLYYENKPAGALKNIEQLHEDYPDNRFFRTQLAEVLLANSLYGKAAPHVNYLLKQNDSYYKMAGYLFRGIYLEKQEKDYDGAKTSYEQAIKTGTPIGYISNIYCSMAYAGLGRYYDQMQETKKAKDAYKKALELASYEYPVKQEAEKYLQ